MKKNLLFIIAMLLVLGISTIEAKTQVKRRFYATRAISVAKQCLCIEKAG
jgi:hypothetical protein